MKHVNVLIVTLFLLFGLGLAQEGSLDIISNWGPDDPKGPPLQEIISGFEEETGIMVNLEIVPGEDIPTRVETAFLGGEEPDLVLQNLLGPTREWVADGVAVPVTSYMDEWDLPAFREAALQTYRIDDELVAFPLEGYNWPMWFNTDILSEAGVESVPTTFEELKTAAQQVRDAGYEPFALGGSDWTGGDWFISTLIGTLPAEEYESVLGEGNFAENETAVAFVNQFVDLRDAGVFADNVEGLEFNTMNEMFFSGEAAMMHGGSWSYGELPEEMADNVTLGGVPLSPNSASDQPTMWSSYRAKGVFVTRSGAEKLDTVQPFIEYLYRPENIAMFVEAAGMLPPLQEVPFDESAVPPLFTQSLNELDAAVVPTSDMVPPSIVGDAGWYGVTALAFVPGTSAEEILSAIEDLYAQAQ